MAIHRYITIFDISIQPKCVSIQYHCPMYHDMTIYRYIVASLLASNMCSYVYTISQLCIIKHMQIRTYNIRMHTYIHIYIHTYIHIHTNLPFRTSARWFAVVSSLASITLIRLSYFGVLMPIFNSGIITSSKRKDTFLFFNFSLCIVSFCTSSITFSL